MSLSPAPRDVPSLLAALKVSDPGRPRVTWYGPDGERVELSARVLDNWVAKTANLLVDELDAGPGTTVLVDLPAHWRTVVWLLSTWAVGAEAVSTGDADVVVTTDRGRHMGTGRGVLVALPALARRVDHTAEGFVDYNAEVGSAGDEFLPEEPKWLQGLASWPKGVRLLVTGTTLDWERHILAPLVADGSIVICDPHAAWDLDDLRRQEHVTHEVSA